MIQFLTPRMILYFPEEPSNNYLQIGMYALLQTYEPEDDTIHEYKPISTGWCCNR